MRVRLKALLKIHGGETRLVLMLGGMMLLASGGSAIGGASIDALFFARFGVDTLPYWYVVLGVVNFLNLVFMAGLAARVSRARLYQVLPVILTILLLFARLLLALNLRWSYPTLYIGKEVINALAGVFLWGLGSTLLDTRQAKRLFPLFTAGMIAGALVGSFATPILVAASGAENMLLVWALALAATGWLCRALIQQHHTALSAPSTTTRRRQVRPSAGPLAAFLTEIREGYQYASRSSLLRMFSVSAVLLSICWFSLLLPFSRLSAQRFPDANALAGFFGLFQGVVTSLALLVSLFLASRLFNRYGLVNMLAGYPLIYGAAFIVLAVFAGFPVLVFFRFIQLTWGQGVVGSAWQAIFNAVPGKKRDQATAFINAVPGQFGIILSGLILIAGERTLQPEQLYWIGLAAAAGCFWALWRSKRAYIAALTESLRLGEPDIFYAEEEPFGGFQRDPAALKAVLDGLTEPDAGRRRLSAEILGRFSDPKVSHVLLKGLNDPDSEVRVACLVSLQESSQNASEEFLAGVTTCLADPQADVRRQAVRTLQVLAENDPEKLAPLGGILQDAEPGVRAEAAVALVTANLVHTSIDVLAGMVADPDPQVRKQAMIALRGCNPTSNAFLSRGVNDPDPRVRQAALDGLVCPPAESITQITQMLGDPDLLVRSSAASALGRSGQPAQAAVLQALATPIQESGALQALENLPIKPVEAELRSYIAAKVNLAIKDHTLGQSIQVEGDASTALLIDSLKRRSLDQALLALRAFRLLGDRQVVTLALEGLRSHDPGQTAYALESLESAEKSGVIRPLLRLWEHGESAAQASKNSIIQLLEDPDAWLRACAALVVRESPNPEIAARLRRLAQSDPDDLVRLTAAPTLPGAKNMETLPTLTTMERILFLRKVSLFAGLPPEDLKQVAAIGLEQLYQDGEEIVHQGDLGDELFIIISGQVRVIKGSGEELAIRGAGEYVGEMALLDQAPRSATLESKGEVRLLSIEKDDFDSILRQRPEVSLAIITVLCERLRQRLT